MSRELRDRLEALQVEHAALPAELHRMQAELRALEAEVKAVSAERAAIEADIAELAVAIPGPPRTAAAALPTPPIFTGSRMLVVIATLTVGVIALRACFW